MNAKRKKKVAVIGPDADLANQAALMEAARSAGRMLAERGLVVLVGGGGGFMAATVEGARQAGGTTMAFTAVGGDRSGADLVIDTGLGWGGHSLEMIRACDGVLAVAGGVGTMQELCLAYLHERPMVALTGHGGWVDFLHLSGKTFLDERRIRAMVFLDDPAQAVETLSSLLNGGGHD
ncbi:SLOG cluster 4 domain-containing protein [Fundidesulfovibrio butyratiphilus]